MIRSPTLIGNCRQYRKYERLTTRAPQQDRQRSVHAEPAQRATRLCATRSPNELCGPSIAAARSNRTSVAARNRPSLPPKYRVIRLGETWAERAIA